MFAPKFIPLVVKQVVRHRTRTLLTVGGVAMAMFLFCAVQAMQGGVQDAFLTKLSATGGSLIYSTYLVIRGLERVQGLDTTRAVLTVALGIGGGPVIRRAAVLGGGGSSAAQPAGLRAFGISSDGSPLVLGSSRYGSKNHAVVEPRLPSA